MFEFIHIYDVMPNAERGCGSPRTWRSGGARPRVHPTPYTLTLHPTPYALHPTP